MTMKILQQKQEKALQQYKGYVRLVKSNKKKQNCDGKKSLVASIFYCVDSKASFSYVCKLKKTIVLKIGKTS